MYLDELAEINPDALLADGFDEAYCGVCYRAGQEPLAAYDCDKCIQILVDRGMSMDEAIEYFEFNVLDAYVGEQTPVFIASNDRLLPKSWE